jgi:hypothetical protein
MMALAAGVAGFTTGAIAQGSGPSGQPPGGINAGDNTAPVTGATQNQKGGAPAVSGSPSGSGAANSMDQRGANAARQAGSTNMDKGATGTTPRTGTAGTTPRSSTADTTRPRTRDNMSDAAPRGPQPQVRQNEPSSPPYPGTGRARNNTADPSRTSPQ